MSHPATQAFTVSERRYAPGPRPYAIICLDGSADLYFDAALAAGAMPRLAAMLRRGARTIARGVLPSFTNPNNASIITGVPPRKHGINGNFFLDPATGEAVMMNDGRFLRAPTIVAEAARVGRKVAVITAKDKLRTILAKDLVGIGFSTEKAAEARLATHGLDDALALIGGKAPEIYSGEASLAVLEAGARLLEQGRADLLYLSTTDYIQHKHAPHEEGAISFYAGIDRAIGRLLDAGAILGITADHGMNAKQDAEGRPNVVYLEPLLQEIHCGSTRVILPITDPYVVHHGALGSFAVIHLGPGQDPHPVVHHLLRIPGITEVLPHGAAAQQLELAPDRLGDLVVMAARDTVLGKSKEAHELRDVQGGLRSHGGRYEDQVPLILSEPPAPEHRARFYRDPRNFDVFEFTLSAGSHP